MSQTQYLTKEFDETIKDKAYWIVSWIGDREVFEFGPEQLKLRKTPVEQIQGLLAKYDEVLFFTDDDGQVRVIKDADPLTKNPNGDYVSKYGGTSFKIHFDVNDPKAKHEIVSKAHRKLPAYQRDKIKSIEVTNIKQEFSYDHEKGEYAAWYDDGDVKFFDVSNSAFDEKGVEQILTHEAAHGVYAELTYGVILTGTEADRDAAHDLKMAFWDATKKEGGLTWYSEKWLQNQNMQGFNENFAEATTFYNNIESETNKVYRGISASSAVGNFPDTYKAWKAIHVYYEGKKK